jgi:hypothetical protein
MLKLRICPQAESSPHVAPMKIGAQVTRRVSQNAEKIWVPPCRPRVPLYRHAVSRACCMQHEIPATPYVGTTVFGGIAIA